MGPVWGSERALQTAWKPCGPCHANCSSQPSPCGSCRMRFWNYRQAIIDAVQRHGFLCCTPNANTRILAAARVWTKSPRPVPQGAGYVILRRMGLQDWRERADTVEVEGNTPA